MRADQVEVSWDDARGNWLLRITAGDEVIRRRCKASRDVDEATLQAAARQAAADEGYEVDGAAIVVRR